MSFRIWCTKRCRRTKKNSFLAKDWPLTKTILLSRELRPQLHVRTRPVRGVLRWPPSYTAEVQRKTSPPALLERRIWFKIYPEVDQYLKISNHCTVGLEKKGLGPVQTLNFSWTEPNTLIELGSWKVRGLNQIGTPISIQERVSHSSRLAWPGISPLERLCGMLSIWLTDRRKTALNLVDGRKNWKILTVSRK